MQCSLQHAQCRPQQAVLSPTSYQRDLAWRVLTWIEPYMLSAHQASLRCKVRYLSQHGAVIRSILVRMSQAAPLSPHKKLHASGWTPPSTQPLRCEQVSLNHPRQSTMCVMSGDQWEYQLTHPTNHYPIISVTSSSRQQRLLQSQGRWVAQESSSY